MWKDLISALILCHNVTPAVENGERLLQGSSPDEVALVKLAEGLGYKLIRRTQFEMSISNAAGYE
jgi:phospholipid-translocating ATPase